MSTITVIPFESGHQQGVIDVILPIQQQEYGIAIDLAGQPDLLDIPGYYRRGNGNFWVALAEGAVVGTISLLDIGNRQFALRKMFVAASHRGPQVDGPGAAARLLGAALDWAAARDGTQVFLGTTAQFKAAHRFYEKHGFLEIAKDTLPAAFPVMAVDSKFYRCEVAR